jgi:hypothetical protein
MNLKKIVYLNLNGLASFGSESWLFSDVQTLLLDSCICLKSSSSSSVVFDGGGGSLGGAVDAKLGHCR